MSNYEHDYQDAINNGEECYYKFEVNNYLGKVLDNV